MTMNVKSGVTNVITTQLPNIQHLNEFSHPIKFDEMFMYVNKCDTWYWCQIYQESLARKH